MSPTGMRRAHASKTWKRLRFEPDDEAVSKDLESLEEKKEVDEEVTEPPKKRRRSRKTGRSRKLSLEEKKEVDEEVTEPPKKRRRSRKTGRSRKLRKASLPSRTRMADEQREASNSRSREDSHEQDDEPETTTAMTFRRKILRLSKINREPYRPEEENAEYRPRKSRPHTRRVKKVKRHRRTKTPKSMSANASPLKQHCLNIRTFARQFGSNRHRRIRAR
ncbi:hypothetical protein COOONC_12638 [Cooperia oncophora]